MILLLFLRYSWDLKSQKSAVIWHQFFLEHRGLTIKISKQLSVHDLETDNQTLQLTQTILTS